MWSSIKILFLVLLFVHESTLVGFNGARRFYVSRVKPHLKLNKSAHNQNRASTHNHLGYVSSQTIREFERRPKIVPLSSSEEPLSAERGELGIPEQYMKVRHGVYKGSVAVFVDSESPEDDVVYTNLSKTNGATTINIPQRLPPKTSKPTTTTTTKKITTKPKTQPPPRNKPTSTATKKVTAKQIITTKKPDIRTPPQPLPPKFIEKNLKAQVLKTLPVSPAGPVKTFSSCLHIGSQCRRHNDCCTHHCNWRVGLKCDYAIW